MYRIYNCATFFVLILLKRGRTLCRWLSQLTAIGLHTCTISLPKWSSIQPGASTPTYPRPTPNLPHHFSASLFRQRLCQHAFHAFANPIRTAPPIENVLQLHKQAADDAIISALCAIISALSMRVFSAYYRTQRMHRGRIPCVYLIVVALYALEMLISVLCQILAFSLKRSSTVQQLYMANSVVFYGVTFVFSATLILFLFRIIALFRMTTVNMLMDSSRSERSRRRRAATFAYVHS